MIFIRIHNECEGRIEKSVPRIAGWHHEACREKIAGALQEFCNRWCKREHVESNALNSWKLNIFLKLLMVEFHFIATI